MPPMKPLLISVPARTPANKEAISFFVFKRQYGKWWNGFFHCLQKIALLLCQKRI
jgi:hypothetical protein